MVTSHDVARVAGVSQATVSRVLRNNPNVDEQIRQRVMAACDETGYVANAHARAMRTNRTGSIGVVTARITNPFYPQLVDALSEALTAAGQRMVLWTSGGSGEEAAVQAVRGGMVDGVIFTTVTSESAAFQAALKSNVTIVLVNRSIEHAACDQVESDNITGGRLIADYFLRHGHTRLAVVGGDAAISTGRDRRAGFVQRLHEEGIDLPDAMTPTADFTHEAGRASGIELLRCKDRPTAIFCVNDLLAFGVLDAARARKIRVPKDLWVAGYDDVAMASWESYDLTTIRQPIGEMAETVVETLLRRIASPSKQFEHKRFETELVVRGSTNRVE